MSISRISDADKNIKSFHQRNDSGELDVFEAARYISGHLEVCRHNGANFTPKLVREERQQGWKSGGRISLDMPFMRNSIPSQGQVMEKQTKDKKYKQPSSPGRRLASFLNSLFHQTTRKKKSKSTTTTQSMKDYEDESPGGRRRRSSISHFRSGSNTDSKTIYLSSSSGFRTPPPYPQTKIIRDLRSYSDHKQLVTNLSKYNAAPAKNTTSVLQNDHVLLDGKFKNFGNGVLEKDREFRKFGEADEGGESDSSSDLFELENYDLGYYSSGLPVYETTHMDTIKRGAPISNGIM
ncbi:protein BIG GRAIN 1-like E [Actinidia eriantha]|uniref:protein BIG GRAIN 1-like E n=1 Tax=Actinidia eriantha TaxID=165200 RepID=UPI00258A14E4|nr:protein BIG GRAIN 1-like E [Actinidia eriantha]